MNVRRPSSSIVLVVVLHSIKDGLKTELKDNDRLVEKKVPQCTPIQEVCETHRRAMSIGYVWYIMLVCDVVENRRS